MQSSAHRRSKGFALLITITLLAFLVLLLVSLSSLTRVETQVASNGQQLTQARENALMALNIAIGQLQEYEGPDQRTTARSDLNAFAPSGRWTGAYGRGVATADTAVRDLYADIPSKISANVLANSDANGNQAVLLNWLVSGNEGTVFNPTTAVDPNGQIVRTQASAPTFTPTSAVGNLSSAATALSTGITIASLPARLLVGSNSVTSLSDYVAAPLVSISVAPGVVPGIGGAGNVTVGRYAWWVGDEGTKARLNLPLNTTVANKPLAFVSAQRAAIELMDGTHGAGGTTANAADLMGYNSAYDPTLANLSSVINKAQLPMLTPASASTLTTAGKYRFHDLTSYSMSVLSDAYAGGLKKDLSAALAPASAYNTTSPINTDLIFPMETNTGTTTPTTNEFGLPTWGMLRDFVQTTSPFSGGIAPRMPVVKLPTQKGVVLGTTPTLTSAGIFPVMTYSAVGFQYGVPQSVTTPADTVGNPINLAIFPVVVLWNPYTTDIQAAQYEFGIKKTYAGLLEFQKRNSGDSTAWSLTNVLEVRNFANAGQLGTASSSYFRFVINSGVIPAGKSLVYTLQTNGATYNTSTNAAMLANALTSASYNPGGHMLMPSTLTIATTGATYRVGVNGYPSTYYSTPVTFFTNTSSNFGGSAGGGPGSFDSYLSPFPPATTAPTTSLLPYTGTSSTGFISQVYQQFSPGVSAPFNSVSPYASPSFPSGSGYAVNTVSTGLLQDESPIGKITLPTFRMLNQAVFSTTSPTGSSSRWIATTNPRAYLVVGTPSSGNSASSFFTGQPPVSVGVWPQGLSVVASPADGGGPRVSSGTKLTDNTTGPTTTSGIVDTTLFEFRPANEPLLSLGQLQHANLTMINGYPSYLIGNSAGWSATGGLVSLTGGTWSNPGLEITASYDLSWLLNRALWDKYFVSTVPHAGTGKTGTTPDTEATVIPAILPNPRHLFYEATPNDSNIRTELNVDQAAAHLLLAGGFNINSTSEEAWRAVLGGINMLSYDPTGSGIGGAAATGAVISRFTQPLTNLTYTSTAPYAAWQGYRSFTAAQVAQLAQNIVAQIQARGPFVSLADFINHGLQDNGTFPLSNDKRLKGVLQAAIDASSTINSGSAVPFSTLVIDSYGAASTSALKTSSNTGSTVTVTAPYSSTAAYAPQFLTQADVLSAIGAGLSARSDTFTIRCYGEALNSALSPTDSRYIAGRAWCEAVVQRVPDYVDSVTDSNAAAAPTATINKIMGRHFKIISFRWLSPNDI